MKNTIQNLKKGFIGESQARNRYTYFSGVAKKEGYEQIAEIFLITADNEREHASWFYRYINQLKAKSSEDTDMILVETEAPTPWGTTADCLKAAIAGENMEYTKLYPGFADMADKEGFPEIAKRIRSIMVAEKHHEERYKKLLEQVEKKTIFKKEKAIWWMCRECGYLHFGTEPPEKCPSCNHESAFYQVKCEEY